MFTTPPVPDRRAAMVEDAPSSFRLSLSIAGPPPRPPYPFGGWLEVFSPANDMLDVALGFLRDELNAYIAARTASDTATARLTRLVDEKTGKYAFDADLIGISLLQIEEERVFRAQLPSQATVNGQQVSRAPELKLNLTVIFAANFTLYNEGLKFLSLVLSFFQSRGAFTADEYPGLDPRIEKLTVELQTLSFEQLNQVWGFIGGKQLPSAFYKVRMVVVQDAQQEAIQPPVTLITSRMGLR